MYARCRQQLERHWHQGRRQEGTHPLLQDFRAFQSCAGDPLTRCRETSWCKEVETSAAASWKLQVHIEVVPQTETRLARQTPALDRFVVLRNKETEKKILECNRGLMQEVSYDDTGNCARALTHTHTHAHPTKQHPPHTHTHTYTHTQTDSISLGPLTNTAQVCLSPAEICSAVLFMPKLTVTSVSKPSPISAVRTALGQPHFGHLATRSMEGVTTGVAPSASSPRFMHLCLRGWAQYSTFSLRPS